MTITATPSEIGYLGNGVTLSFAIPFVFDTSADLKVYSTVIITGVITELTTGFTVTGGSGSTGNIAFSVAPASTVTITILDDPALTQPADYISNDAFPAETHERALDRVTRISKRLYQTVQKTLRVRDGDASSGDDLLIPTLSSRASKFLAFDANGNPIASEAVSDGDALLRAELIAGASSLVKSTAIKYDITPAEISAGVVPVNYAIPSYPLNLLRYGTNTTPGTTDMLSAVNSLVLVAKQMTSPHLVIPDGLYYISALATFDVPSYSTIEWNGKFVTDLSASVAIRIGSSSTNIPGIVVNGHGVHISRTAIDYAGSSTGVQIANVVSSRCINIAYVSGFSAGVWVLGSQANGGVSYCNINLGQIWDNRINLYLSASGSGYCNENSFYGGTFNFSSSYGALDATYANTYNIYEDYFASSPLNGNKFYGPSLEASDAATVAALIHGVGTHIYSPRLEVGAGVATDFKINFTSNSSYCLAVLAVGGNLANITDSGTNNSYTTNNGAMFKGNANGTTAAVMAQASTDNNSLVLAGRDISGTNTFTVDGAGRMTLSGVIKQAAAAITYSTSMTPNADGTNTQRIGVTNNTAFTINAPSGTPTNGQRLKLTISNSSGGAMGAITWNSIYKMSAWTNPANGFSRSIEFEYNGTNWVQGSQTDVDVPN